jgi:hypothetical protein
MATPRRGLFLAVLVLVAACAENGRAGLPGDRPGATGKADAAGAAADFDRLAALLGAKGTVVMPPLGVANAANELDVTVTVHSADEVKAIASQLIAEVSEDYVGDPATGTLLDAYDEDVHVSQVSAWNDEAIQRDLLAMISERHRGEVSSLVDGYMLHFTIYQTASEITAEEIFVYRPTGTDRALIVRVSYAHA